MGLITEDLIKLGLAILVGGLIGAEREFRDKAAGFRTIIFITVGSALFTIFSISIGNDPARIAANIVTGIGFLGAGTILRESGKVAGLTTAATIWLAAALGMGLGGGSYVLVGIATVIILAILWVFPSFEHWLDNVHETRTYEIVLRTDSEKREQLHGIFHDCKVRVFVHSEAKSGDRAITTWRTSGRLHSHKKMVKLLMDDKEVLEFKY
jgi:putative Mg2+ transporter-C (MgtC) family protein